MKRTKLTLLGVLLVCGLVGLAIAQRGGIFGGRGGRGGGRGFGGGGGRLQDLSVERNGVPIWNVDPHFKGDVFTFVRLEYESFGGGGNRWLIDYPDSDLNFSFRLQQMTSLKVEPVPQQIRITDEKLFNYPFVYMLEIAGLEFREEEIPILRRYLLNGGFLMVDDHWGLYAQRNWYEQIKRVFPEREPVELTLDHPIFHCVFDLKAKPQVPGIGTWEGRRQTWEQSDDREPHYRAIYDDKGRMMVLQCANTDLGDGWEREGENEEYFHMFSEKQAYPMGINIIFYAMTH